MEQDLKLRMLNDKLQENYHDRKDEVITLLMALQHQSYVLGNSITNLVKNWPHENHLFITTSKGVPIEVQLTEFPQFKAPKVPKKPDS